MLWRLPVLPFATKKSISMREALSVREALE
jgi:hypothetical protein